ncbi:MAG: hypothetical protein K2M30_02160 [Desulfovibrionaceae bacterium]|nr:hypothetical protein [Desulfovibrionaceae bacterium]
MTQKSTTRKTYLIQGIAMCVCLVINMLGASTTLFSHTIGDISALYPTPLTPAPFTFSIWFLIFFQWIYDFIWNKRSISTLEYILNALWIILFCNEYIITSYFILLIMSLRMIYFYKGYVTYTTWLCVACSIQGYIVGGITLFFFTILTILLVSIPLHSSQEDILVNKNTTWKDKERLISLVPYVTSLGVILWAIIGILVKQYTIHS